MQKVAYALSARLNLPVEEAVHLVKDALRQERFDILTEIDVRQLMKDKIDADFQRYVILGACDASLAYVTLQKDPEIGLLLPWNVVVREQGDGATVSVLDPAVMVELSGTAELEEIARIARGKIEAVLARLTDQYIE